MTMRDADDISVEYVIEPIPGADPDNRFIPHFTIHARRGNYTSGAFVWVTTEATARRVARAMRRDDDHYDALYPQVDDILADEARQRGWVKHG